MSNPLGWLKSASFAAAQQQLPPAKWVLGNTALILEAVHLECAAKSVTQLSAKYRGRRLNWAEKIYFKTLYWAATKVVQLLIVERQQNKQASTTSGRQNAMGMRLQIGALRVTILQSPA